MKQFQSLLFGTGGTPLSTKKKSMVNGITRLRELNLDAMELEFVHGSFPKEEMALQIAENAKNKEIRLTAHGPYYINLNAIEEQKIIASKQRIINTAYYANLCGAESITFHAGFFLKMPPDQVYDNIKTQLIEISNELKKQNISVDIRPELTGKPTQFGSVNELLQISKEIDNVLPCIDWSHLYARTGKFNTEKEFDAVLRQFADSLGEEILKNMHMHVSGIEFNHTGERRHLGLQASDFNYRGLLDTFKRWDVRGILVCESPLLEEDATLMKDYYYSL